MGTTNGSVMSSGRDTLLGVQEFNSSNILSMPVFQECQTTV
jgi:hypothetical protein